MFVRKVAVENVRSFLDRAELDLDGPISILIGPNGGGKTNLLDTIVIALRRYLFASMYALPAPTAEDPNRHEFRPNDQLDHMVMERHSKGGKDRTQLVEVELEVTERDIQNMQAMKKDAPRIREAATTKYYNLNMTHAEQWDFNTLKAGQRFIYKIKDANLQQQSGPANSFLEYLKLFEIDSSLREEYGLAPLTTPMVYLTVNRSGGVFQSSVQLATYQDYEQKRQNDAVLSRRGGSIVSLAVGRLAQKYRLLLEKDKGVARTEFYSDPNLKQLTILLRHLGYEWSLESVDPLKNVYDVRLKKQGSSFLVGAASSGERELLTYLFAIFALNVRDALIIVDEPELHLHPKWQKTLTQLFVELAESTGNQFLLATHAPTFVSPQTIQYVSRVFSQEQRSHVLRLDAASLPDKKHLFNIINSQNNERIFFRRRGGFGRGESPDRIFFEAVLEVFGHSEAPKAIIEIIDVGGKGFFDAYRKVLDACKIKYSIIADLDYVENVGPGELKSLFKLDSSELKKDVIDNIGSVDGDTLVAAIERSMQTGNWEHAQQVWAYVKSRRTKLRANLNDKDEAVLQAFITAKREENIYILSKGTLEDYLPVGYQSKDLEKLIRFLATDSFWDMISEFIAK